MCAFPSSTPTINSTMRTRMTDLECAGRRVEGRRDSVLVHRHCHSLLLLSTERGGKRACDPCSRTKDQAQGVVPGTVFPICVFLCLVDVCIPAHLSIRQSPDLRSNLGIAKDGELGWADGGCGCAASWRTPTLCFPLSGSPALDCCLDVKRWQGLSLHCALEQSGSSQVLGLRCSDKDDEFSLYAHTHTHIYIYMCICAASVERVLEALMACEQSQESCIFVIELPDCSLLLLLCRIPVHPPTSHTHIYIYIHLFS